MMKALLERARHNGTRSDAYDKILRDFAHINGKRNDYVHGTWQTRTDPWEIYLIRPNDDPYLTDLSPEKFDAAELEDVIKEMNALHRLITLTVSRDLAALAGIDIE